MKIKKYLFTVLCLGLLILSGCDDNVSLVGNKIWPDGDLITAYTDTFQIVATTVQRDSLFAKTTAGLLGNYYDPLYGKLKADYLCQFYCEDEYQFRETPKDNQIDSIYVAIYYRAIGNPNTPFQVQVFPVTKPLDKVYYSNANPDDYCDLSKEWGSKVFTADNGIIFDSTQISANTYMYYRVITVPLPYELGQSFYEETVNNPAVFKTQQAFNDYFPGIYVTTGYGNGCLFDIQRTAIFIDYTAIVESTLGVDSVIYRTEQFITTKEVIQLNRFENSDTEQLLAENDDFTFVKSPAGIYTRLVFPAQEIKPIIEGRIINSLTFSVKYMPNEDWPYTLEPPPHLLLLPEDSLFSFFYNRNVDDNLTSYISVTCDSYGDPETSATTTQGYSASNRTYYFNNIAKLMAYHISVSEEDLRLLLVPVRRRTGTDSANLYYSTEISNYLSPSGVKLRKDKDLMKVSVITSKYNNK